jgi:DNA-binding HxlR family transcriptional regulator
MSLTPLIDLSQALGRKNRFDILRKLSLKSCRNTELSEELDIRKERVSEALADLVASRLVIMFEREAIIGEKHTLYVSSPFGSEILTINQKLDTIKEKFPEKIADFGDGIAYILRYYLETDVKATHNTIITRGGRKVNLVVERMHCEKKNCEITCEPLIKNVVKRFGELDQFERTTQEKCSFNIKFWRK